MEEIMFLKRWFILVSLVLCLIGFVFTVFGFTFFPSNILPPNLLLPWVSAIYGSIMIGWGVTLFLIGRLGFKRKDITLLKILLLGIVVWLVIEAVVSLYVGVYFNIGVDFAVLLLFGIPIIRSITIIKSHSKHKAD